MSREADTTIKGFLYQFIKTLNQILIEDNDSLITVEGKIEDIDVETQKGIKAIQCKYHESNTKFEISNISKPILQFLKHYAQNINKKVFYNLYAYFPYEEEGKKDLTIANINNILKTKNIQYLSNYISFILPPSDKKIERLIHKKRKTRNEKELIKEYYEKTKIEPRIDIELFLTKKFKFLIGKSYDELAAKTKELLKKEGFNENDVGSIIYPNAIQLIAELSIKPNANDRKICKRELIEKLRSTKSTALTRWTKELLDLSKILKIRKKQLSINLNCNRRRRYFIFNTIEINNFENDIVNFLYNFINKYSCKPKLHAEIPIFCFDKDKNFIFKITQRLYSKNIEIENGYRGDEFYQTAFLRQQEYIIKKNWMEFHLRICFMNKKIIDIFNMEKADDIFIINKAGIEKLDCTDINIEKLEIENISELEYLLNLRKEI